jgi:hypothetical protein
MRGLEPTAADGAAIIRLCRLLRPGGFMAFQRAELRFGAVARPRALANGIKTPGRQNFIRCKSGSNPGGELLGGSGARRLCGPCEGRARQLRMPVIGYLIQ